MVTKTGCSIPNCGKPHKARGWCNAHYQRWCSHDDPLGGKISRGAVLAWLDAHKNFSGDECLIWPFTRNSHGYGRINYESRMQLVSRIVCHHRHGPPPSPKHQTAHSCGNGHLGCVNGSHLRWATRTENEADKLLHGTHNRGEQSVTAKLTKADVLAIRAMKGRTQTKIAAQFGVSQMTINDIVHRRKWAWL